MAGCERVSWFCFLLVAICGTCGECDLHFPSTSLYLTPLVFSLKIHLGVHSVLISVRPPWERRNELVFPENHSHILSMKRWIDLNHWSKLAVKTCSWTLLVNLNIAGKTLMRKIITSVYLLTRLQWAYYIFTLVFEPQIVPSAYTFLNYCSEPITLYRLV